MSPAVSAAEKSNTLGLSRIRKGFSLNFITFASLNARKCFLRVLWETPSAASSSGAVKQLTLIPSSLYASRMRRNSTSALMFSTFFKSIIFLTVLFLRRQNFALPAARQNLIRSVFCLYILPLRDIRRVLPNIDTFIFVFGFRLTRKPNTKIQS